MTKTPPPRRRPPKQDTERALAARASARHLKDLRRAHRRPPADVEVSLRGVPRLVPPIIEQSYCTSPAALCAELAEEPARLRGAPPSIEESDRAWVAALCAELAEEQDL